MNASASISSLGKKVFSTATKVASATDYQIMPRKPSFDWQEIPKHWIYNDAFSTHFANVLHLMLPAGERWFCRLYAQALPHITDGKLRQDVQAFIRQEAHHARAHDAMVEMLRQQGLEPEGYTALADALFNKVLGEKPLGPLWIKQLDAPWYNARLALIAAVEHFTGVLGDWILNAEHFNDETVDPIMLDLLRWHGAEEVEHRNVAFDLHRHLGGGYLSRQVAMVAAVPVLSSLWAGGVRYLGKRDPEARAKIGIRQWLNAAREGRIPGPMMLANSVWRFVQPNYHPLYEADTAQALAYLARSPAANA